VCYFRQEYADLRVVVLGCIPFTSEANDQRLSHRLYSVMGIQLDQASEFCAAASRRTVGLSRMPIFFAIKHLFLCQHLSNFAGVQLVPPFHKFGGQDIASTASLNLDYLDDGRPSTPADFPNSVAGNGAFQKLEEL